MKSITGIGVGRHTNARYARNRFEQRSYTWRYASLGILAAIIAVVIVFAWLH